jgi:hypothetical protein
LIFKSSNQRFLIVPDRTHERLQPGGNHPALCRREVRVLEAGCRLKKENPAVNRLGFTLIKGLQRQLYKKTVITPKKAIDSWALLC